MVTHGEWTTTNRSIARCRGLKILNNTSADNVPPNVFVMQLHPSCPLCRFFKDVMDVPGASEVAVWPINHTSMSRNVHYIVDSEAYVHGAHGITPTHLGLDHTRKFILGLSYPDGIKSDDAPTSWKQFYTNYQPRQPFPYHSPKTDSVDMDLVRVWVAGCQVKHTDLCVDAGPEIMSDIRSLPGFQLIDCNTSRIVIAPEVFQYVALSYVWGQPLAKNDGSARSCNQLGGNLPSNLPETIRDAMTVTLRLGYRYLWVDKYCINQALDSNELEEQLAGMGAIYHGAVVTIIAAAGNDTTYGLPGIGSRPRVPQPSIKINGTTWVSGSENTHSPTRLSKWATRGWTYQEAHFSRRRLMFTDEQVLFQCHTCCRNETMHLAMGSEEDHANDIFGVRLSGRRSAMKLDEHIALYTCRILSYPSDILNALHGLFSSFATAKTPSKQLWGIPTNSAGYVGLLGFSNSDDEECSLRTLHATFGHGLTWTGGGTLMAKRRAGFPSWSWSAWESPVGWPTLKDDLKVASQRHIHFALVKLDGDIAELTDALVDELSSGRYDKTSIYTHPLRLRIEAEILQVRFVDLENSNSTGRYLIRSRRWAVVQTVPPNQQKYYWLFSPTPDVEKDEGLREALTTQVFDCVILNSERGLVTWDVNGTAERLGILSLRNLWGRNEQQDSDKYLGDYLTGERRAIVIG